MLAQGVASRCSRVDAPRSACAPAQPPRNTREAIIGGAICRFRNSDIKHNDLDPMTHSSVFQLNSVRPAVSTPQFAGCSAPAIGRWDDVCPSAIVAAVYGEGGRSEHRLNRDHRRILAIAYEAMPKGSALDRQPRGARDNNGADSDEGPTR